jgi:hypothetical protein
MDDDNTLFSGPISPLTEGQSSSEDSKVLPKITTEMFVLIIVILTILAGTGIYYVFSNVN